MGPQFTACQGTTTSTKASKTTPIHSCIHSKNINSWHWIPRLVCVVCVVCPEIWDFEQGKPVSYNPKAIEGLLTRLCAYNAEPLILRAVSSIKDIAPPSLAVLYKQRPPLQYRVLHDGLCIFTAPPLQLQTVHKISRPPEARATYCV